jgi:spermidine/putrescine transport system permease protein
LKNGRKMVERKSVFIRVMHTFLFVFSYLFLYLPIFVLVLFSFNDGETITAWEGFSLRWYKALLAMPDMFDSLKVSLIVAFSAMFLSLLLGTMLVFATKWWRPRFVEWMFHPNIVLPEIVLAVCLLSSFAFFHIPLGYESLIVGHTLLGTGFVVPIIRARFRELDPILIEASADLGALPHVTFRKIVVPLLAPSLLAAALLVFTLSLDDFFISFFCSGTDVEPLSIYIYTLVREGLNPSVNAIAACLLAVSSLFVLVLCYFKVIDQVIGNE